MIVSILSTALEMSSPLILAALGEVLVERAGILNLGVEGMMLLGAFGGLWGASVAGSLYTGLLTGAVSGLLIGIVFSCLVVELNADQVSTGLAIWILSIGLTTFLGSEVFKGKIMIETLSTISIPILSSIPALGPILFQQNLLVYLTVISVFVVWVLLYRTRWGLCIRSVGENPSAADTLGINVFRVRHICVLVGGFMAGLAGAIFTLVRFGTWQPRITAGAGWMALVITWLGKRDPVGALAGGILFGGILSLQYSLQGLVSIPYQFMLMLPYAAVVITLLLISREERAPGGFTEPYSRE